MVETSSSVPFPKDLSLYRYQRTNKSYTEDLGGGVTLTLMLIPSGEFMMGAAQDEPESRDNERPRHRVVISQFLMGRYPVTQAQWRVVAGYAAIGQELNPDPSEFKGDNRPVEGVSWDDAQEFCQRLSTRTGKTYCLPSEAQWEYACRAGTETPFHFGETLLPELANYDTEFSYNFTEFSYVGSPTRESRGETTDVGSFPANDWGLHDMHGNIWEWCEDDYHSNYNGAPKDGRAWIVGAPAEAFQVIRGNSWVDVDRTETHRVLRGGSWDLNPRNCRSAVRYYDPRDNRFNHIGFRVCCVVPRTSS